MKFREMTAAQTGEPSAAIRERVVAARQRQQARFAGKKITCNARMGSRELKEFCALDEPVMELLKNAMTSYTLGARAYHRILKVACTITADRIRKAIQFRSLDRQLGG